MPVYGPKRHPALRWPEPVGGDRAERGNLRLRCKRRSCKWKNHEGESTEAELRGGTTRSSDEVPETGWSEGVVSGSRIQCVNQQWEEPVSEAKPFSISKWEVWEAYKRVKANHGAAGVDEQSIVDFERNLKRNLYK